MGMSNATNNTLTETLKRLASELASPDVTIREVQGVLYITTAYTTSREWAANVEKVRAVAKVAQARIGRESVRQKAVAGGFWHMGCFCKERVTMAVKVTLTEDEDFAVLRGDNP